MTKIKPKRFNVTGPCVPADHYMLPPLDRIPGVHGLIDGKNYFVLRGPHQSGKTTAAKAFVDSINDGGNYYALYCSLGGLATVTDDAKAMGMLISKLNVALMASRAEGLKRNYGENFLAEFHAWPDFAESPAQAWLRTLCARLDKDLVVFFGEADCLGERSLLSFLSQLRDGHAERPTVPFPRSIALIGMRNIRDYEARITDAGSMCPPFNFIKKTLTMADFTEPEIKELYTRHTKATGQVFTDGAVSMAWYWSEGQPWLVNALACEAVEEIMANDYETIITGWHVDQAAENLMARRDTHIGSLLARLSEPRVRRFIGPMLAASGDSALDCGDDGNVNALYDDLGYCLELGLLKNDKVLCPANPIYAGAMVRFLTDQVQSKLPWDQAVKWKDDYCIDVNGALKAFQRYWAKDSERYLKGLHLAEAGPHILLTAFLRMVVNGEAAIINEYADGQGYADIVIEHLRGRYAIELRIGGTETGRADSFERLEEYTARPSVTEAWLVTFDRSQGKDWTEKITWETEKRPNGFIVHVVGC
ncbi:MAG: hypothetical protein LBF58_02020 [Deltaproteobacteria bacterium]|jgi:hypothetical protein|nr:hypothetical protein [Deltaproteobacteria bacterium]